MQSSLAIVLSLTLGFSPHPCVSIFGTGRFLINTRSFSWKLASWISVLAVAFHIYHAFALTYGFACMSATSLIPTIPAVGTISLLRHSIIQEPGTGISTCCPSTTPFGLALGPDLPRADEPSSGNLGFSVRGILTHVSLLTPAFSLPCAPTVLPVYLHCTWNAPLPLFLIHSFGNTLSPGKLSAQSHSTSELLRTL